MEPRARRIRRPGWRRLATLALAAGLVAGTPAPESKEPTESAEPSVGLDQLLRLPESLEVESQARGGATATEWRARFQTEWAKLNEARTALERAQVELEGVAEEASGWQMSPPGAREATQSPVSYQLRQEIRRHKEEIQRAERSLGDLDVEADLASVPEKWRN